MKSESPEYNSVEVHCVVGPLEVISLPFDQTMTVDRRDREKGAR